MIKKCRMGYKKIKLKSRVENKLYNRIEKAIHFYIYKKDPRKLRNMLPTLSLMYNKYSAYEQDYRSGYETYGYDDNIRSNMCYISDRFRCAFRLRWLIDGIKDGHI